MKCFTASSNRAACRAASNAASRSRLAVVRCQASQNGMHQTFAAVAASSLLMVSPAFAELVPVDNFSKNLESEYEQIIAARTGKSSALPELTAPPPADAPAEAEYVKPVQIKTEKLEVVKAPETKVQVPAAAAEPVKAVAAPAALKPAPAAAPKPAPAAVPAAIKAVAPEAPSKPAPAKPVPEAIPAKTTTSPAILIGAVGLVALIAVGASSSNKQEAAPAAPAAPAAEPTPAAPSEASSSEQTPSSS